jgi:16S rRNA (guanine527-N7)-methyltransferase
MELLKRFIKYELKDNREEIINKFILYNKLLLEWNSKINLISRNSESIETQVLNSIFFLARYNFPENAKVADIGTGGGFPGVPLKILYDRLDILLIDSIQKKMNALNDIIKKLRLKKAEVKCERAENLTVDLFYKNKFDLVTAKSVATLDKLYNWSKSLLKDEGEMIFIKGGDISEEINVLKKKNISLTVEVLDFKFDSIYNIEDKKVVIIK